MYPLAFEVARWPSLSCAIERQGEAVDGNNLVEHEVLKNKKKLARMMTMHDSDNKHKTVMRSIVSLGSWHGKLWTYRTQYSKDTYA